MREEVFHLTLEELERMSFEGAHKISLQRVDAAEHFKAIRFPRNLTVEAIEEIEFRAPAIVATGEGVLTGVRVSGSSPVAGRALVVNGGSAADVICRMQEGDILVSPIVSPDWLPHFSRLGGVVAEVGGWLSHTAILAREFDLPMVVQVDGLESITDGTYIEVGLDGAVRVIAA
jgi:phosphohistidine swiveling domain-containing protein